MEHIKANHCEDNDYLDSNFSQPLIHLRWLNVRTTEQPHQKTLSVYCKHICKNKHREKNIKKNKYVCFKKNMIKTKMNCLYPMTKTQ